MSQKFVTFGSDDDQQSSGPAVPDQPGVTPEPEVTGQPPTDPASWQNNRAGDPTPDLPRLQQPRRGRRLARKPEEPASPLTGEQRLLVLDPGLQASPGPCRPTVSSARSRRAQDFEGTSDGQRAGTGPQLQPCGGTGTVRLWEARSGELQQTITLNLPCGYLGGISFSPDGRHLATANGDGTIYVLRLAPAAAPRP